MRNISGLKNAQWLNPPPEWRVDAGELTLESGNETDFWRDTLYGFRHDNGHAYLTPVSGDFTAHLTFDGAFTELYDQAGLMLRESESRWIKAGIEVSDGVLNMSVVITRDASDWSTLALGTTGPQRLRLTRLGRAVIIQFRNPKYQWQLLRVANFSATKDLLIGPMACSPKRAGLQAHFTEFTIGPAVAKALHDDSPAG